MTDDSKKAPRPQPLFGIDHAKPKSRLEVAAAREAARAAARAALTPDDWARLDRILFTDAIWIRAKTYEATNPHAYLRRRDLARTTRSDADFAWLVEHVIRGAGTRERFPDQPGGRYYSTFNYKGWKLWTMGWPLNYSRSGAWCTVIVNRKPPLPSDR
jgi:hypothetical protein